MKTTATVAQAKGCYDRLKANGVEHPSDQMVVEALAIMGRNAQPMTIARWRKRGWVAKNRPPKAGEQDKVEQAKGAMERTVPVLTGDPTTTVTDLVNPYASKGDDPNKRTEELVAASDDELQRQAARDVFISAAILMREAANQREFLVKLLPADTGALIGACALAIQAGQKAMMDIQTFRAMIARDVTPPSGLNGHANGHLSPLDDAVTVFAREIGGIDKANGAGS